MRLQIDDSVILVRDPHVVGIVESVSWDQVRIKIPSRDTREKYGRQEVRPLAEVLAELRRHKTHVWNGLNLNGKSTFAELVSAFGYATRRLRQESFEKVCRQLLRAGLEVKTLSGGVSRDDVFRLDLKEGRSDEEPPSGGSAAPGPLVQVSLPETFWPTAFGLPPQQDLSLLHALMEPRPILSILNAPSDAATAAWFQATWEGIMSWAFRSAQRFIRRSFSESGPEVLIGPASLLHSFLKVSVLSHETPQLNQQPNSLNLVTLRTDADLPVDFERLRAVWPGPVFRFDPELSGVAPANDGQFSSDVKAILECLLLAAGCPAQMEADMCPLKTLLWSMEASAGVLTRATARLGELLSESIPDHFKGSNEGSTALALKADVASWIRRTHKGVELLFEYREDQGIDDLGQETQVRRIDLAVESMGRFEVESLVSSGPIEGFYHQKVFSRLNDADSPLWLVVPNEAILWAGPYLADIAHHMGEQGHVLLPGLEDSYLELKGKALSPEQVALAVSWSDLKRTPVSDQEKPTTEPPIHLKDFAGYAGIRAHVEELIIWPERHRGLFQQTSRSSGILFFGPPGCGKSRLARAIAGELEQEVRLVSPSELRGAYVGWGQILIREQFDWVAENDRRMLVIDELDAVARSRRDRDMHSDEKANVNELLVQLDRVGRLGRLVVGTTNYVSSLDEAVIRSGRFGRFIPVPPPNLDEAVAILDYYLQALCAADGRVSRPRVHVLHAQAVRGILKPIYEQNASEKHYFCGADLEEAVNRAYSRRLRETFSALPVGTDYATVAVQVTGADLVKALKEVPRSVNDRAAKRFLRDVDRFCGQDMRNRLSESLNAASSGA